MNSTLIGLDMNMNPRIRSLVMLCIFVSMTGCWKNMEEWSGSAVWSDDDTAVVGIYEYFRGQNTITHTKKRDIESELYLMPYNDLRGEARQITTRSPGRVNTLFFMKSANYLIVNREQRLHDLDQDMNKISRFYVDKVSMNGTITSLGTRQALTMISCDAQGQSATTTGDVLSAYPSPNAEKIARVETNTTCQDQTVTITFLNSETLEQIGESFEDTITVNGQLGITNYAWLETGRFARVSTSIQGPTGFTYAPNTLPEPLESLPYECFFPATSSSDISSNGVYVSINNGEVDLSEPDPTANVFGCPSL